MAKADISLKGKTYSVACAPGQEARIEALSEQLQGRVAQIEGAVGDIGGERLLLLAALALLDELDVARGGAPQASELEAQMAGVLEEAAAKIEAIAGRVEAGN